MKKILFLISVFFFTASSVYAQAAGASGGINPIYLLQYGFGFIAIINFIILPVLMAIAFIVFIWGIFKYFIYGATSETEKGDGRKFAMWGIVGFVIIFSVWGLVRLLGVTLGLRLEGGTAPPVPTIHTRPGQTPPTQLPLPQPVQLLPSA